MLRYHIWSYPDAQGAKHCLLPGCSIRVREVYAQWQQRKGAPWVSILTADIPKCSGVAPKDGV
jgi:hypothetical protein